LKLVWAKGNNFVVLKKAGIVAEAITITPK